jgi:NitT/TauT family transport system substrate-binding protein
MTSRSTPDFAGLDRRRLLATGAATLAIGALPGRLLAATPGPLRVGAVKYGSLNWLIETIRAEGLDRKFGLELTTIELSNNHAGPISLLSGGSDVVVSDWTWALRQRGLGEALKFAPYSATLGSVVVPADSSVKSLTDLAGKRLGVAGSSIDKSWLLLQAYARKTEKFDIATKATVVYGAAPLVTEQMRGGKLDAALNFWTQTVRLKSLGFRDVISMRDVFAALAIDPVPAFVGFIWKETTEASKGPQILAFLAAAEAANGILAASDAPWERLRGLMKPQNDAEFDGLRAAYRSGIVKPWSSADMASAATVMRLLVENGDTELVGAGTKFDPKLFHAAKA